MSTNIPSPSFHDEIELWQHGNSNQPESRSVSELSVEISSTPATNQDHVENDHRQFRRKPVASALKLPGEANYMAVVEPAESASPRRKWTPMPLRTLPLISFVIVFATCVAALELAYQKSERRQGLSTVSMNLRYLWTYGPTAVFILIAASWGQVEYRTKQHMPWEILARGPSKGENSLLLDYIAPWNGLALFSSLRNKHFPVAIAIVGSFLLKLIIVVSTGLFMAQDRVVIHSNVAMRTTNRFDAGNFSTILTDSTPALSVLGVKRLGLQLPFGTTDEFAVQLFAFESATQNQTSMRANVDVFAGDLECENAVMSNSSVLCEERTCPDVSLYYTLDSTSCHLDRVGPIKYKQNHDRNQNKGITFQAHCSNVPLHPESYRYIISIGYLNNDRNPPGISKMPKFAFSHLICKPKYYIQQKEVVLSSSGVKDIEAVSKAETYTIPGISATDIAQVIQSAIKDAQTTLTLIKFSNQKTFNAPLSVQRPEGFTNWTWDTVTFDPFFILLNATSQQQDSAALTDAEFLKTTSRKLFQFMSAQIASTQMMVPDEKSITGSFVRSELRLYMRELSVRIMEVCCLLLCIVAIALRFLGPRKPTPHDTSSLGGLAIVVANSQDLKERLRVMSTASGKELTTTFRRILFQTQHHSNNGDFQIKVIPGAKEENPNDQTVLHEVENTTPKLWRPLSFKWGSRVFVLGLPILVSVALEVLYQSSMKNNGLATIESEGYIRYSWVYVPALVMLLIRTFYDMVDFSARLIAPYDSMKKRSTPAGRSVLVNYLSKLTLHSLWISSRNRHWSVIATNLTMLLAPFLTIVSSGLYLAQPQTLVADISLPLVTGFNMSQNYTIKTTNTESPLIINLLGKTNLSHPQWTHKNFVMPSFQLPTFSSNEPNQNLLPQHATNLMVQIPVFRAHLDCTSQPEIFGHFVANGDDLKKRVTLQLMKVPKGCGSMNPTTRKFDIDDSTVSVSSLPFVNSTYYAKFNQFVNKYSNRPDCPSISGIYGTLDSSIWSKQSDNKTRPLLPNLHGFYCYPSLRTIQASIEFSLPNLDVISTVLNESTSEIVPRNETDVGVFDIFQPLSSISSKWFDSMFFGIVGDENPAEWLGNDSWPKLYESMQNLYGLIYAQSFNIAGRIASGPDAKPLSGELRFPPTLQSRLIQDATSTRVLEALLILMFICAVVAFWLLGTKDLLPAEPTSIVAMAALIAGSRMVGDDTGIMNGSQVNDWERRFEGGSYKLGWWDGKRGEGKRFGIDDTRAETDTLLTPPESYSHHDI